MNVDRAVFGAFNAQTIMAMKTSIYIDTVVFTFQLRQLNAMNFLACQRRIVFSVLASQDSDLAFIERGHNFKLKVMKGS